MTDYERWLSSVSYKPGWSFEWIGVSLYEAAFYNNKKDTPLYYRVTYWTNDVHSPEGLRIQVSMDSAIIPDLPKKAFIAALKQTITTMELHERDEWLKVDGATLVEPHPQKA